MGSRSQDRALWEKQAEREVGEGRKHWRHSGVGTNDAHNRHGILDLKRSEVPMHTCIHVEVG
jgi:hypothetical protein